MDTNEIQKRVDAIAAAMVAKALLQPTANFVIRAHCRTDLYASWKSHSSSSYADAHQWFEGAPADALNKADAWVASLPSPEETRRAAFIEALSDAIEKGKAADIEVDTVNLLMAEMKRLSKNALQHKPEEVA